MEGNPAAPETLIRTAEVACEAMDLLKSFWSTADQVQNSMSQDASVDDYDEHMKRLMQNFRDITLHINAFETIHLLTADCEEQQRSLTQFFQYVRSLADWRLALLIKLREPKAKRGV